MSRSEFESVSSPQSSGSFNLCSTESVASSNLPFTGSLYFSPSSLVLVKALSIFFSVVHFYSDLDRDFALEATFDGEYP